MQHFFLNDHIHFDDLHLGLWFNPRGRHLNMNFHDHDFSELAIILEGSNVMHLAQQRTVPLQVGDVLLLHPHMRHAYQNTADLQIANILFDASYLPLPGLDAADNIIYKLITHPEAENPNFHLPIAHLDQNELAEVNALLLKLNHELKNPRPIRNLISLALFMQLLGMIIRAGTTQTGHVFLESAMSAVAYINENFNKKFSIAQLARRSNLSERDFYRKFHAAAGMSPLEYKRKKQLEYASYLLQDSRLSLSEIADQCGFCDSNHLIREFSRMHGISPGKFRKSHCK